MELIVVVLIIGILGAAAVPLLRGRVDSAKWAESKAAVDIIRSAVQMRFVETGVADSLIGNLGSGEFQRKLGFHATDLVSTYFEPADYTVTAVNSDGVATIRVTGSKPNAPPGSWTLDPDGNWSYSPAGGG